jgi:hypothetical protein
MPDNSLGKFILGSFVTIAGLFVIVFHKELRERSEDWNARVPWFLQSHPTGGRILTVMIILAGAGLIYAGIAEILSSFAQ